MDRGLTVSSMQIFNYEEGHSTPHQAVQGSTVDCKVVKMNLTALALPTLFSAFNLQSPTNPSLSIKIKTSNPLIYNDIENSTFLLRTFLEEVEGD